MSGFSIFNIFLNIMTFVFGGVLVLFLVILSLAAILVVLASLVQLSLIVIEGFRFKVLVDLPHHLPKWWSVGFYNLSLFYPKSFRDNLVEDMYINFIDGSWGRVAAKGRLIGSFFILADLVNIAWQGLVVRFERVKEFVIQS